MAFNISAFVSCLSPHGESGLKLDNAQIADFTAGLSPHGESGLKSIGVWMLPLLIGSLPARGEWIEISKFSISV